MVKPAVAASPAPVTQKSSKIYETILALVGSAPWFADKANMSVPLWFIKAGGLLTITIASVLICQLLVDVSRRRKFGAKWQLTIVGAITFASGIVTVCWLLFPTDMDPRKFYSDQMETIYKQTFTNEKVEIDGKIFDRCTFKNVTFIYHGMGGVDFRGGSFEGSLHWHTDNIAVRQWIMLLDFARKMPGFAEGKSSTLGDDGEHHYISPVLPSQKQSEGLIR